MAEVYPKKYIGKRIAATVIDYTIVIAITWLYIMTFGTETEEGTYTVIGISALVPFFFWCIYFIVCEAALGGTLGHQLLSLKIVSTDGRSPTFGQIIMRRISDALEISCCLGLIAFILVNTNSQAQRLGDIWAKTIVLGKNDNYSVGEFDFEKNRVNNNH